MSDNIRHTIEGFVGKRVYLVNGEEDIIMGYDKDAIEIYSLTRVWDKNMREASGDEQQNILAPVHDVHWLINLRGYSQIGGQHQYKTLRIKDQYLARLFAREYNKNTKDPSISYQNGEFSYSDGPQSVSAYAGPGDVFDDEEALSMIKDRIVMTQRFPKGVSLVEEEPPSP